MVMMMMMVMILMMMISISWKSADLVRLAQYSISEGDLYPIMHLCHYPHDDDDNDDDDDDDDDDDGDDDYVGGCGDDGEDDYRTVKCMLKLYLLT